LANQYYPPHLLCRHQQAIKIEYYLSIFIVYFVLTAQTAQVEISILTNAFFMSMFLTYHNFLFNYTCYGTTCPQTRRQRQHFSMKEKKWLIVFLVIDEVDNGNRQAFYTNLFKKS